MSIFVRSDEAPALNFVLRVLTPIVYLIIVSTILYKFRLDRFVIDIYMVNIYYIVFRFIINIITNRARLLNMSRQFVYWISIIVLSYITYKYLIQVKKNVIPDFTTIANELWIIMAIFVYQLFNKIQLSNDQTQIRKDKFLDYKYSYFNRKYEKLISEKLVNEKLQALAYSILIYEDFNRPRILRIMEYISFFITRKPHTLGVMQYRSKKYIGDNESVLLGISKLLDDYCLTYDEHKGMATSRYYERYNFLPDLIAKYNGGTKYKDGILELYEIILDKYYNGTSAVLLEPVLSEYYNAE